jgi:cysteinyl-tRNA synthetase
MGHQSSIKSVRNYQLRDNLKCTRHYLQLHLAWSYVIFSTSFCSYFNPTLLKYFINIHKTLVTIAILALFILSAGCKERRSDKAGERMQKFVIDISNYARTVNPDFVVVPQNGPELGFSYLDPGDGVYTPYLSAIDGFGNEEVFYEGTLTTDMERLDMLRLLEPYKKILNADYLSNDSDYDDAVSRNQQENFVPFPRRNSNHDYKEIPTEIVDENSNDIQSMAEVKNYLYLISTDDYPTKEAFLAAIAGTNYDLVLIDLFFDEAALSASEVNSLKIKANGGQRLVISYINIGAAETYRYYWQDKWKLHRPNWLKKRYEGYDDEFWVKFWKDEWQEIIYGNDGSYIKKILDAGFDGAYLDNVEVYYFLYFD